MTPNTASNSLDSSKGCWALDWEGFQRETTGNFEEIMVIFTKPNICERTSWENWNKAWDPGKAKNAQLIPYSHLFCHVWGSILTSQVGCTSVDWSHAVEQPTCVGVGLCDIGVQLYIDRSIASTDILPIFLFIPTQNKFTPISWIRQPHEHSKWADSPNSTRLSGGSVWLERNDTCIHICTYIYI